MTQYRTYIDSDITAGLETIQSIQTNGSEYGIGISSDVVCNNISAGIITASNGFISVANTTPIKISLVGNKLTFSAVGIGSTTFTLA